MLPFEKEKALKFVLKHLVNLTVLSLAGVFISDYAISKLSRQQNNEKTNNQLKALHELVRQQGKLFHSLEGMGRKVDETKESTATPTEQFNDNPRDPASDDEAQCTCSD